VIIGTANQEKKKVITEKKTKNETVIVVLKSQGKGGI